MPLPPPPPNLDDVPRAEVTASPVPIAGVASERDRALLTACGGAGDAALFAVAREVAAHKARALPAYDDEGVAFLQRAAGEPHPWARTFVASAPNLSWSALASRLDSWRRASQATGPVRCGVASTRARDGADVVSVVAVDALADLSPLPERAHAGQWLTVDARLRVAATGARVVVQGPGASPRGVPTSFDAASGRVRARFAPDRPGAFTVQVLAELPAGPRPVLEASVFADVDPPRAPAASRAPGEDESSLLGMVNAARASSALPTLARDAKLDALALDHARAMVAAGKLAHDVGDGDPAARIEGAYVPATTAGENVARAESVSLAHRALWASPSHRANVLSREFDRAGTAVVADPRGAGVWVVELFAGAGR